MGHAQWDTRDQGLPLPARGIFSRSLCIWVSLTVFPMGCLHAGLSLNLSSSLGFSPFLPVGLCLSGHLFTCPCSPGLGAGNDLSVLQVHPHHHGAYPQLPHWPPSSPVASAPLRPGPRPHPPFSLPGLPHPAPGRDRGGLLQHPGLLHVQHLTSLLPRVCAKPQHVLEGELRSQHLPGPCGEHTPSPLYTDTSRARLILARLCSETPVLPLVSEYKPRSLTLREVLFPTSHTAPATLVCRSLCCRRAIALALPAASYVLSQITSELLPHHHAIA